MVFLKQRPDLLLLFLSQLQVFRKASKFLVDRLRQRSDTLTKSRHHTWSAAFPTFSGMPLNQQLTSRSLWHSHCPFTFREQVVGKETLDQRSCSPRKRAQYEAAINRSVVSNLARTPSLDNVPGCPVRAVARPLTTRKSALELGVSTGTLKARLLQARRQALEILRKSMSGQKLATSSSAPVPRVRATPRTPVGQAQTARASI
jgi:hypothetical protein